MSCCLYSTCAACTCACKHRDLLVPRYPVPLPSSLFKQLLIGTLRGACRQPKPDAGLKPFDSWEDSDKQFDDPEESGGDVPGAADGPYAAHTPAKQAGTTAPQDMLSPPSLGAATAIAEMCRASMSGPLAAAPSAELAEPTNFPAPASRSMVTREHCKRCNLPHDSMTLITTSVHCRMTTRMSYRHAVDYPTLESAGPPPGAREREFAAGRIDEQQLEQGKARLEPFHEIARNLPQLAQSGTHRLVRSGRLDISMASS